MSNSAPERPGPRDSATARYEAIRNMIVDGSLPPGSLLLETVLSKRLGVSRTPVREALARLAQEGLINREVRGYVVKRRTPEEILEIYEVRIVLESACAARAAEHASPYDLARLEHLTAEAGTCTDYETHLRLNTEWHAGLRAAAHNETMTRLLDELSVLQQIYNPQMHVRKPAELGEGQAQHVRIIEAIRRGDAETARAAMTEHLSRVRDLRVAAFLDNHGKG
ncbi:GntR family transcriptional regulator [Actinomadura vinacea]|uniref:GntR family transcriptional regulator n=1 Tax=Actinomadura vinacea TaxID=115336 RepID=A0ABN3JRC2_9ACTN